MLIMQDFNKTGKEIDLMTFKEFQDHIDSVFRRAALYLGAQPNMQSPEDEIYEIKQMLKDASSRGINYG